MMLVELQLTGKEESVRAKHAQAGTKVLANDLCYGGKLMYQLYLSNKRQINVPNPLAIPGSGQPEEMSIGGGS
jgi:hypothetical protein